MDFDFKEIFTFSFIESFKQKGAIKYLVFWSIFLIVLNILESFAIYSIFAPVLNNPNISPSGVVSLIVYAALFIGVLVIIASLVAAFINYFILALALKAKGKKQEQFTILRGIKLILLGIASSFASFFSIFKLKFLLVPIAGIILVIVAFILFFISSTMSSSYAGGQYLLAMLVVLFGVLLLFVALLLFLVYLVIICYNVLRLSMSQVIFVEGKKGLIDCLKSSWEITRGKVLSIFLVLFVIGIAVGVVGGIISVPLNVYMGSFNSVSQVASFSKVIQLLVDPVVIVLSIPSILLQVAAMFIEAFALVAMYSFLSKSTKANPKTALPKRKLSKGKK
ncbi:MAG: hypothetical protein WCW44_05585 [archaeon]|jgi:hypothetical protein